MIVIPTEVAIQQGQAAQDQHQERQEPCAPAGRMPCQRKARGDQLRQHPGVQDRHGWTEDEKPLAQRRSHPRQQPRHRVGQRHQPRSLAPFCGHDPRQRRRQDHHQEQELAQVPAREDHRQEHARCDQQHAAVAPPRPEVGGQKSRQQEEAERLLDQNGHQQAREAPGAGGEEKDRANGEGAPDPERTCDSIEGKEQEHLNQRYQPQQELDERLPLITEDPVQEAVDRFHQQGVLAPGVHAAGVLLPGVVPQGRCVLIVVDGEHQGAPVVERHLAPEIAVMPELAGAVQAGIACAGASARAGAFASADVPTSIGPASRHVHHAGHQRWVAKLLELPVHGRCGATDQQPRCICHHRNRRQGGKLAPRLTVSGLRRRWTA